MAKVLTEMPKVKRPGRKAKYDYDKWFDMAKKEPIQLTKGEDFKVDVKTMRHNLYRVSDQRGLDIETVTITDDNGNDTAIAFNILKPANGKK